MARGGARVGAGRRPQPTALKILRGNPGRRPLPQAEPQPPAVATLDAPDWLDEGAELFWQRYAPLLASLGLLKVLDVPEFGSACELDSLYRRLMKAIMRAPQGKRAKDLLARAKWALTERDRILGRFGFDPASRAKLSVEPSKAEDEFETFLQRRKA